MEAKETGWESMGRKRVLIDEERKERKGRPTFQMKLAKACEEVVKEIQDNPPHLICWLRGGINREKPNEIRCENQYLISQTLTDESNPF